jgi:para-nitrobenzyl esterase
VFRGNPNFQGQATWPRFDRTNQIMSLRVAGQSQAISTAAFRAEHQCDLWDALA